MREVRTNDIYESMRKGVKKPRLRVESERIGHFVRCVRLLPPDDREGRSVYVTIANLERERGFSFVGRWFPQTFPSFCVGSRPKCASCVHDHHPHSICNGRSGGTAYRCSCLCPDARNVP